MAKKIVRCISCDGFGWFEDDFTGEVDDCDWCNGVGYVYRDANGADSRIPSSDYEQVGHELEQLETDRMRDLGYQGQAKKPWQQDIRKGTQLGQNPHAPDDESDT